jgi:hypothetical protein
MAGIEQIEPEVPVISSSWSRVFGLFPQNTLLQMEIIIFGREMGAISSLTVWEQKSIF